MKILLRATMTKFQVSFVHVIKANGFNPVENKKKMIKTAETKIKKKQEKPKKKIFSTYLRIAH